MIIGNGDIAKALKDVDRSNLTFFASGVSNSKEKKKSEYKRERDLLFKQKQSCHLVYFSSLSVFYSNTPYACHKRDMEHWVKKLFNRYTIIRLGNITWGDNPHTIINYFKNSMKTDTPVEIKDTHRYIVDEEEFLHWIKLIPSWSCEINIPGKRLKVMEIYQLIEEGNL